MSAVHIFYGHAKRRDPSRPRCSYCNKRPRWIAFTYFGMPLCRDCWDGKWRSQEDGECNRRSMGSSTNRPANGSPGIRRRRHEPTR